MSRYIREGGGKLTINHGTIAEPDHVAPVVSRGDFVRFIERILGDRLRGGDELNLVADRYAAGRLDSIAVAGEVVKMRERRRTP